jgi:hypothetical protein
MTTLRKTRGRRKRKENDNGEGMADGWWMEESRKKS